MERQINWNKKNGDSSILKVHENQILHINIKNGSVDKILESNECIEGAHDTFPDDCNFSNYTTQDVKTFHCKLKLKKSKRI